MSMKTSNLKQFGYFWLLWFLDGRLAIVTIIIFLHENNNVLKTEMFSLRIFLRTDDNIAKTNHKND